jgi:tetratricopeptide (TPR) repeat protein
VQTALRADRPEGVGSGVDSTTVRPGAAAANGGDSVAPGFPPGESMFRNRSAFFREHSITSYRRGDFVQAISDLNEAIRLNPDDAQAYILRGNVRDDALDFKGALTDYDEAIRLDPTSGAPLDDRAILWRRKREIDKALADLDRAVGFNFADAKTYCDRGLIWYEKGSVDRAMADFTQAIKLDPNFAIPYLRHGAVLHRSTEFNVAFTIVYPSIRVDPKILDASRRPRRPVSQPAAPSPAAARSGSRTGPANFRSTPAPADVQ